MQQTNGFDGAPVPVPENWLIAGQETTVDCETACWLRMVLGPVFEEAPTWRDLQVALRDKGYKLAILHSRLVLMDAHSERPICTSRFLGSSLGRLSERLGNPEVGTNGALAA